MSRVAIAYPRANLDTVPSLIGTIEALAAAGHAVDVWTYLQAGAPEVVFSSPLVRLRPLGTEGAIDHATAGVRDAVKRAGWLPAGARAPLLRGYRALGAGLVRGSRLAARARGAMAVLEREPYGLVIGVDPDGLALAHDLARGAPLGYYSLELLLSYEIHTPAEMQLKAQERELSRRAAFVIVQDEARGRLLAEDNGLDWRHVLLVPNAPDGPARRRPSRFWHARFDLASSARVVLHSGSLGGWTGIEPIVASAANWPDPWVLVVHTRYDAESSAYVDELRRSADPARVKFSLRPVARHAYDALVDGADVGLAFYVATGDSAFTQRNVQTIGLSSGKLAYYARAGLPIVVNAAASIAADVEAARCGVSVADASEIGSALSTIAADYAAYSVAACRFFAARLDFARAFAAVLDRVAALDGVA